MRCLWIILLVLLFPSFAYAEPLVKPGERVWLLGDSNGGFLLPDLKKLAETDGVVLDGNPVGGASLLWWTDRTHRKYIWQMNGFKPDVVLIVLGTNEAHLQPHVRVGLRERMDMLLSWTKRNGQRTILIGPPTLPEKIRKGAMEYHLLALGTGLPMLDSRQCSFPMWPDGIHPSVPGRKVWAAWIWKELISA